MAKDKILFAHQPWSQGLKVHKSEESESLSGPVILSSATLCSSVQSVFTPVALYSFYFLQILPNLSVSFSKQ